jgi:hypothetical protein
MRMAIPLPPVPANLEPDMEAADCRDVQQVSPSPMKVATNFSAANRLDAIVQRNSKAAQR